MYVVEHRPLTLETDAESLRVGSTPGGTSMRSASTPSLPMIGAPKSPMARKASLRQAPPNARYWEHGARNPSAKSAMGGRQFAAANHEAGHPSLLPLQLCSPSGGRAQSAGQAAPGLANLTDWALTGSSASRSPTSATSIPRPLGSTSPLGGRSSAAQISQGRR
eukprot:gnl/TRDRNA2_/TRDRNA2_39275_c0_seq1.p1 gnl/TRDRNA2_/TRDRNA2_39275_c0~~gnl/TRDRNA2_/TRDRNA2_39275_c0_seq1.p1  ORF type:complete len:164 (+),score=9.13 gnl/TRDRNA2_/TRDRNA2_39275_c0_seq1:66-557(+)